MTHQNVYQKLGHRISEEVQLLAEKKWILEALAKIKNQRNSLQIERLHLESLKAKLNINPNKKTERIKDAEEVSASTSAVNLMQNFNSGKSNLAQDDIFQSDLNEEATCNVEELNLGVSNTEYNKINNIEEDEESDEENMLIDMNMLMNGSFSVDLEKGILDPLLK